MRIAVTGASGFLGSALVPALRSDGHDVVRLVRRDPRAADEVRWDPARASVDSDALGVVDGAVHLAGAGVGDKRWSAEYKRVIRDSRVDGTTTLATALAGMQPRPSVLVSASGIGYYGDAGDRVLGEDAPAGDDFLAQVCVAWEASTAAAAEAGVRVCTLRTGQVLSRRGGALARMLPLARLGLGGPLGSGRQYWSFVTLADYVRIVRFLLTADVSGPVNAVAPHPVPQREVARTLGRVVHRPALLPAPAPALRVYLGEFSTDVLGSQRAEPRALARAGFVWQHPDIESALRWAVAH